MDVQKILKVLVKIICAPIALILFGLFRIFQFFIGISGIAVTFVCLLTSVVLTIGVFVQIFAQINGQGPGMAPIMVMAILAGALAYVPAAGVRAVLEIVEGSCGWIWKIYFGSEKPFRRFYRKKNINGQILQKSFLKEQQMVKKRFTILKAWRIRKN